MIWAQIAYPEVDPIIFQIGPFALRWYALAYVFGLIGAWHYCRWLTKRPPRLIGPEAFDDFLVWATLGVVLGGRLGYILFYKPGYYLSNPLEIFMLWEGGMSFHGGFLGVMLAVGLFARKLKVNYFTMADIVACAAPIGIFLGRLANFINGELFGRAADPLAVPWAMVFPARMDPAQIPRHPSQLYEAGLEGIALFLILMVLVRLGWLERPGRLSASFLCGYGLARLIVEFFREPDQHLGFFLSGVTMGQILSLPMLLVGLGLFIWSQGRPSPGK